jgi:hypothetical protein
VHVRINLLTIDPAQLEEAVRYLEDEARPVVEEQPGSLGMSVAVDHDLGLGLIESFWVSGDAMRESEKAVVPLRKEVLRRGPGTLTVEHAEVVSFTRVVAARPGAGLRLTRLDVDPRRVDAAVAAYEDTAVPWLSTTDGFCSARLYVERRPGRGVLETLWRDPNAMAASRGAAAAVRADTVAATEAAVRALQELRVVFTSARTA